MIKLIIGKRSAIFFTYLLTCALYSHAQKSDIYSPYSAEGKEKVEFNEGYCKNENEEKKLWLGINKYAKSLLKIFPQIPPEQKSYINGEINSDNVNRFNGVMRTSFFKMSEVYENTDNIEKISSMYISNYKYLSLSKKWNILEEP